MPRKCLPPKIKGVGNFQKRFKGRGWKIFKNDIEVANGDDG